MPRIALDCLACGIYLDGPQACAACIKWQIARQRHLREEIKRRRQQTAARPATRRPAPRVQLPPTS